jgi:hypothetical protein
MNSIAADELPNRAFRLAYFLHRERQTATEIATRALNKLQLAATAQGKRLYYRLTGRADSRKARSKVSLGEPHLLQRLVYIESEEYERRKEAAAQAASPHNGASPARRSDMVVHFIKHLVRISSKRNSFYVTLGLSRLLYNYTTPETMELYNLVIQDPDRVHDDYYYRSRKALLLRELKERFGELVEVARGLRGEQRWRSTADSAAHSGLVRECLLRFTPWSTPCVVPDGFNPLIETIDQLNFQGRLPDQEHEVEVNRIHAAVHPDCFARLTAANRLAAPDARLELPEFLLAHGDDDNDDSPRTPPDLSEAELRMINDLLVQESLRRKSVSAGLLRVLVDGIQRAEINAAESTSARFSVDQQADLIEVYSSDERGPLLLATHLMNFNGPAKQTLGITTEGGQRISFAVELLKNDDDSMTTAVIEIRLSEASTQFVALAAQKIWSSFVGPSPLSGWWQPAAVFAVLALLLAGSWWVWTRREGPSRLAKIPTFSHPSAQSVPAPLPARAIKPTAPNERLTASPGQSDPLTARQESPVPPVNKDLVQRSLVPDSNVEADSGEAGTRGPWTSETPGKPLGEIRQVHIQAIDNAVLAEDLLNELRTRLAGANLKVTEVDQADAALKVSVRRATSIGSDPRLIVVVRAVNANGYTVWPRSRRSASWHYVGQPRFVAQRIVNDLKRDIASGR